MGNQFNISNLTPDEVKTVDTLTVNNNATVGGTLGVTGATTLNSTLAVTSGATLSSTLAVTGISTFASHVKITTTASGIYLPKGTSTAGNTSSLGTVTLSNGGKALIYSTQLSASTLVFFAHTNSSGNPGVIAVTGTLSADAIQISSSSVTDASAIAWWIVTPYV